MDRNAAIQQQILLNMMSYVGEQCVVEAITNGSYQDRTGNLRSSVGYVVVNNGLTYRQGGFQSVGGTEQGFSGIQTGNLLVQDLVRKYRRGIVLIVVAGTNYATYVAARGYNVLDSAELNVRHIIRQMMSQLNWI